MTHIFTSSQPKKDVVVWLGSTCSLYLCSVLVALVFRVGRRLEKQRSILFSLMLLEKAMAPHSSTLTWKIPWTEEPGGLQSMGSLESDTTERLHFHFSLSCIGEGNGTPLQCSCLENPRDGEPGGLPFMGSHRVRHD